MFDKSHNSEVRKCKKPVCFRHNDIFQFPPTNFLKYVSVGLPLAPVSCALAGENIVTSSELIFRIKRQNFQIS